VGGRPAEFEAATGATVEIIADPIGEAFPRLLDDAASGTNSIDCAMIGMWWLGDLVAGDYVLPYDDYYNDTTASSRSSSSRTSSRACRRSGCTTAEVRDPLRRRRPDPLLPAGHPDRPGQHAGYKDATGNDLGVPTTWDELIAIAEFFNGKDLNGDGQPDNGVSMHIKVGGQGMFHFMSLSAPYVIGPRTRSSTGSTRTTWSRWSSRPGTSRRWRPTSS
jgi:multiple sugar transport system substrate-binding protein